MLKVSKILVAADPHGDAICSEHGIPKGKFTWGDKKTSWCCPKCSPQYVGKPGYQAPQS